MDATTTVSTPRDRRAPSRSMPWLACAALILAVGCSASDDNNVTPNNTTANNTTANNTTANNTTANNTTANNTTANNTTANNTTATTGEMVTFTLTPFNASTGMMLIAEMCVRDTDNCAVGDAAPVSIEVPKDTDVAVTLGSEGFVTATWYVNLTEDRGYNTPLLPEATMDALIAGFGFADDPTKGHIFFQAQTPTAGLAGVALTVSPNTYEAVLYNRAMGPDPALMETDAGNGAFVNVDAGTYELTGAHATLACGAAGGHQQTTAGAAKFDIAAGEATYVFVVCE